MNRRNAGFVGILVAALFANLISCTKVNDTVGNTLIPDDQRMQVFMDTVYGINGFLCQADSFPLNMTRYGWYYGGIGSKEDPTFGKLESGWLGQYGGVKFYTSNAEATDRYGTAPQADSLYLYLAFTPSLHSGDTTVKQKFNVYEVTTRIYQDSTYYMGRADFSQFIDREPLFTFECTGSEGSISKRMAGLRAEDLMKRLLKATTEQYENDSLFVNEYKGIYIAPADGSPKKAAVLGITLASSSLILYAHNYTDATATTRKDTVLGNYSFNVSTYTKLTSLNNYSHDYTNSAIPVSRINDTLETAPPISIGYIQGCGGVTSCIRFTKDFVQKLHDRIRAPFKTMVINSARLEIGVSDPTNESLDMATNRLGLYTKYATFSPITDYAYNAESSQYNPVTIPYGGYLNRSRNSYTMDITRTMQIMADVAPKSYMVTVAPSVFEAYNMKQTQLDLKNDPADPLPLRVVLTYTLIR